MPPRRVSDYAPGIDRGHRSVVSLHSHTHHSKEVLHFLPAFTSRLPVVGSLVRREMERYEARHGRPPEFANAYWVPPFTPLEVLESERAHIASRFDLPAVVSISDHDTIEAGLGLLALRLGDETVISVEWTVPYRGTNFHLGVHNLPSELASVMMGEFAAYRRTPDEPRLAELLAWVDEQPDTLVVLNHPLWNANGDRGQELTALEAFIQAYRPFVHAAELNGYRECAENRDVVALACAWRMPLVAGGDRHGRTPNALVNLSQAATIAGFVGEVRRDQRSETVVLPEYRRPRTARVAETVSDVLRPARPGEPGQAPWMDRVFIVHDDGRVRPIADYWADGRCPWWVRASVRAACAFGGAPGQRVMRRALAPCKDALAHPAPYPGPVARPAAPSIARGSAPAVFGAAPATASDD
jgi:hypothetical protein